ncbi:MAG: L,D-transpeptidase [Hyphomicrobiaceae bacterium]
MVRSKLDEGAAMCAGRGSFLATIFLLLAMLTGLPVPVHAAPDIVPITASYPTGAIVVVNKERRLYYILGNGHALRYPIAVGVPKEQWTGQIFVQSKQKNPGWSPTPDMRRRNPGLPQYIPGGPRSPLGSRAIYLGWSNYRIHGTLAPGSIGQAASNGCFRMHNQDVNDLYERVHIGAPVYVIEELATQRVAEQN